MKSEKDVAELLGLFAQRSNRKMERLELDLYLGGINDLGWPKVHAALGNLFKSSRQMPTVDEIREACGVKTEKPMSDDELISKTVSRIDAAIGKFGQANPFGAREHLGPLAWKIVEEIGGWHLVSEGTYPEVARLMTNARFVAKAVIKAERLGIGDRPLTLDDTKVKLPDSITDAIKRITDATTKK